MDDATLVQQAVAGDDHAFAAIYDRYAARIHDFVRALLRDPDEAADVLQDTFLVAGARLHQLRDPSRLRPWLYAIARHRALRVLEQRSRLRPLDDVDVTATDPDPADEAGDASAEIELAALVAAAGEGLGPRDRVVLDLHLRQGLEGQDLGDAMGVSASHAYVLVSRLRDQVERSLGALLVARRGREDCADLAAVLRDWDGRFTPVWRKRVARHTDGCPVCSDHRRRLLTPAGLLGGLAAATPAFALPAGLRDRVLGDLRLCSHTGPPWAGGEGGFPPPAGARRSRTGVAVAVLGAVLLGVGAWLILDGQLPGGHGGPSTEVAAVAPTPGMSVPTTAAGVPTASFGVPTTTSSIGPVTSVDESVPVVDDPAVVDPDPDSESEPDPEPTTTAPTTSTIPPPDTMAPELTGPRPVPASIHGQGPCANGPRTARVSVGATDASRISSVVLEVGGRFPSSSPMTRSADGLYEATVGPFAGTPGAPVTTLPLTVRATDAAGNSSTSTGSLVLRCDPPGS